MTEGELKKKVDNIIMLGWIVIYFIMILLSIGLGLLIWFLCE